ncbi:hypothetical protein BN77_p10801 [Rhizobium mesoamericanum STM3625]|uniref:Uncharacterized protein n=1 Tax=Rhizobium mesoamericanum STM3625 TaxID=1211777 RepID=K0PZS3_9HYPH|nr:hypothetical protein BN77_p10801 [Rhizobium mesoamericanum STM3625]
MGGHRVLANAPIAVVSTNYTLDSEIAITSISAATESKAFQRLAALNTSPAPDGVVHFADASSLAKPIRRALLLETDRNVRHSPKSSGDEARVKPTV